MLSLDHQYFKWVTNVNWKTFLERKCFILCVCQSNSQSQIYDNFNYILLVLSIRSAHNLPFFYLSEILSWCIINLVDCQIPISRLCSTGLPSDVIIEIGDTSFHLHKVIFFSFLSQELVFMISVIVYISRYHGFKWI